MSKFKLGDLIRPKKNPTYLPDEVLVVVGLDENGVYVDTMKADGSSKYSNYERIDMMQDAYPVPVLLGDTVIIRGDVRCGDVVECTNSDEIIANGYRLFKGDSGASYKVTGVSNDGGVVRLEGASALYPAAIFEPVERAEPKMMSHAEIEAALGFRFEMEDD